MRGFLSLLSLATFAASAAVTLPGDAERGQDLFRTQQCIACHSVNGEGGKVAPDLGKSVGRDFTPSQMAGLMWNHAPAMWAAMQKSGVAKPQLTEEQAADLFAYFYAARFFERPGDAARGRQVFTSKRCADCHSLSSPKPGSPRPVSAWHWLTDPIGLAAEMWNHAPQMAPEFARKNIPYPQLTAQEFTDLRVYLQNLPETRGRQPEFSPASARTGEELFQLKGCTGCHKWNVAGASRPTHRSLTEFSVAMWNHAGKMGKNPPLLNYQEMRRIVGYLWSIQLFEEPGNPGRGKQVFARKNCATCHNSPSSGAPSLAALAGNLQAFTMVDALWKHGPAMLSRMEQQKLPWPRFSGSEMADLTAYLNQPRAGGAAGR